MNTSDALNYYKQIKNSFSGETVAPGAIPQGFVANWGGTAVYKKGTFLGRFWQVFHLFARTEESSMRSAILKIVNVAEAKFAKNRMKAESTNQQLAKNTPLNEWWAGFSIEELNKKHQKTIQFSSFSKAVQWAKNEKDIEIDNKPKEHLDKGIALEKAWHRFTKKVPISLLARELRTEYDRKKIETRISEHNQKMVGSKIKGGCPAYLLYASLVAIADKLRDVPQTRFNEVRKVFDEVVPGNKSGDFILEIVKYLQTPDETTTLPHELVDVLKDKEWVAGCNLDKNYSLPIESKVELQPISLGYSASVLSFGAGGKLQMPFQFTHTTNFCYQRFPERVTIVDRYPNQGSEISNLEGIFSEE